MTSEKLQQQIQQLHNEIDTLDALNTDEKLRLEELLESIRSTSTAKHEQNGELNETLTASVARFEATHPRITAILNDIMVTLSNMGI